MARLPAKPRKFRDKSKPGKSWGISQWVDGERRRSYYTARHLRDDAMKELLAAEACLKAAGLVGATPEDVQIAQAVRQALSGRPLMEMLTLWKRHRALESCTVKEAAEAYLLTKQEDIDDGNTHVKIAIEAFRQWLKGDSRQVGEIARKEIIAYFDHLGRQVSADTGARYSPTTVRNRHKVLRAWFNYCVGRELMEASPVRDIPLPEAGETEIEILSVPDVFRLLHRAYHDDSDLLALLSLSVFAGVRTSAIHRLEAEDIRRGEGINFPAAKFKTKTAHFATGLPECFWTFTQNLCEPGVLDTNKRMFEERRKRVAAAAGVKLPSNWGRHSFATYFSVLHGDVSKAAAVLGHRSSVMTWKHYKGLASEFDAKAYFALRPRVLKELCAPEAFDIVFAILKDADAKSKGGSEIEPEDLIPKGRVKAGDESWANAVRDVEGSCFRW